MMSLLFLFTHGRLCVDPVSMCGVASHCGTLIATWQRDAIEFAFSLSFNSARPLSIAESAEQAASDVEENSLECPVRLEVSRIV